SVSSPRTAARRATADGSGTERRPTGRSGCVTTRGTCAPLSSRRDKEGTANSGVPKKTAVRDIGKETYSESEDRARTARELQQLFGSLFVRSFLVPRSAFRVPSLGLFRHGRLGMANSPEAQSRPDPARGEENERESHEDPEHDPGARPAFLEAEDPHREEKQEAVE